MEELKKKRKTVKGGITRILNYCESENVNDDGIISRCEQLEQLFKEFNHIQGAIESLIEDENLLKDEEAQRAVVEEKFHEIKAYKLRVESNKTVIEGENSNTQIAKAMNTMAQNNSALSEILKKISNGQPRTSTPLPSETSEVGQNSNVRLPHIKLPEFDGNYTRWLHFRDLFQSLIHDRVALSEIEKFDYLKSHLSGDALSLIKHLPTSKENYTVAWELIKNKYENSAQLKKNYFKLLFDQQPMKQASVYELQRILNTTNESVNALKALKEPIDQWDNVLLFHLERKLDNESQTLWCRSSTESAMFCDFEKFLQNRLRELELVNVKGNSHPITKRQNSNVHMATLKSCPVCKGNHYLYSCDKFKELNVHDRRKIVNDHRICANCLQYNHFAAACKKSHCKVCNAKHNSLLHIYAGSTNANENMTSLSVPNMQVNTLNTKNSKNITLLPTAVVLVISASGTHYPCRVLLDTGAQTNLISENCVRQLGLRRTFDNTVLIGVSAVGSSYSRGKVEITMKSRISESTINTHALCLPKLTQQQPIHHVSENQIEYFNQLSLADPNWNQPNHIDIILGASVFSEWALNDQIINPDRSLVAMSTIFGWVIIGNVKVDHHSSITVAHLSLDVVDELQKFWELEEVETNQVEMSLPEQKAEEYYQQTTKRNEEGKYIVRLPFKDPSVRLSNKNQAYKRYYNIERKLNNHTELKAEYLKFMNEYLQLNHMQQIENNVQPKNYLPHHAVLKYDSTTTKLRVVFDGSAKDDNGNSLNENLLIGPTIQHDIYKLLLQFRKYRVALCADIEKMYRQILVHPDDCIYQCILWRFDNSQQVSIYQLNTVTYGTSAAPFLAVRTLKQIALDYEQQYPAVAILIQNHFYVDDFMASFSDEAVAIQCRADLNEVLSKAGMHLRKWSTNSLNVMQTISMPDRESSDETMINDTQTVKTLGLYWEIEPDKFKFRVVLPDKNVETTKRHVLSTISRIYDPLGFLAPFVVSLKIFMQRIWLRGVPWDSTLPDDLLQDWVKLYSEMKHVTRLQIPRWLQFSNEKQVELHGFADSFELAYSSAIYLRIIHHDGHIVTNFITSKTKVAPVKQVSLPRLELCACQLTAKLLMKVSLILNLNNVRKYGWTDSKIALAWISEIPRNWNNFVANRTSDIIKILPAKHWRHVPSKQNPADLATRGITIAELEKSDLWWKGPSLLQDNVELPGQQVEPTNHEKRKKLVLQVSVQDNNDIRYYYSNFNKLVRVIAMILRFVTNCQKGKLQGRLGWLTTDELNNAHRVLVKKSQHVSFQKEISTIKNHQQLPSQHKLAPLIPFIDDDGLLRVGGRLTNASISFEQKHPLILHKNDIFTQLIIQHYHKKYLHAGTRQLQYLLGLRYWIPAVVYAIKRCVYKCPTCMRYRNKPMQQQMADLPASRLKNITAFHNVGIDYAGPIMLRSWKGRGAKTYKGWIALFVCMSTKAIHLEFVTDLTTEAFLASLRRFVARRGRPANIHSDNGTNFVGCHQKLKDLYQFLQNEATQEKITQQAVDQNIQWHFTPPSGPHFGGLWEAGVKSVKRHLHRILGNATVTYEEMNTVLCQIESCLNSRPLSSRFSGDPDPLTPSHFLIFKAMETLPDHDYSDFNINRLSRWQYLQALVQNFWKRWSIEYLSEIQNRPKWKQKAENLQKDDLVFVKSELCPPCQWPLGKVLETHPGNDGLVRVVTVKTQRGVYKRPISKL